MSTSAGACCGTHCLRLPFSKCRLCLIRAKTRDAKRKEDFIAGELESDDRLKYASCDSSREATLLRAQFRKMRTRTHALSGRTSLTLASRKVRASVS